MFSDEVKLNVLNKLGAVEEEDHSLSLSFNGTKVGGIDVKTEEEELNFLNSLDLVYAVKDGSNYIITDENRNIIMW